MSSTIHILPFYREIRLLQCLMTELELNNELDVPVELADVHCTSVQGRLNSRMVSMAKCWIQLHLQIFSVVLVSMYFMPSIDKYY